MKYLIMMLSCFLLIACESVKETETETETKTQTETSEFGGLLNHNNPKQFELNEHYQVEDMENYTATTEIQSVISEMNFDDGLHENDEIIIYKNESTGFPGQWLKVGGGFQLNQVEGSEIGSAIFKVSSEDVFNFMILEFSTDEIDYFQYGTEITVDVKYENTKILTLHPSAIIDEDKYLIPINLDGDYKDIEILVSVYSYDNIALIATSLEVATYHFSEAEVIDFIKKSWVEGEGLTPVEAELLVGELDVDVNNVMASKTLKDFNYIYHSEEDFSEVAVRLHSDEDFLYYYFSKYGENTLWFELKVNLNEIYITHNSHFVYSAIYTDVNSSSESVGIINKSNFKLNVNINTKKNQITWMVDSITHENIFVDTVEQRKILIEEVEPSRSISSSFNLTSAVEGGKFLLNLETVEQMKEYTIDDSIKLISVNINVNVPQMAEFVELSFDVNVGEETSDCYLRMYVSFIIDNGEKNSNCFNKNGRYSFVNTVNTSEYIDFSLNMYGDQRFIDNYYQIEIDNLSVKSITVDDESWNSTWDLENHCRDFPISRMRISISDTVFEGVAIEEITNDIYLVEGEFMDKILTFTFNNKLISFEVIEESGLVNNSAITLVDLESECNVFMSRFIP
ncbi:MAG: hypothetical protein HRU38_05465 [Saccharospirillaceae bacterium]|nr:hypothetical protein [Pseudomonadales bacterium]NRB78105.1 hypothetical protein [Saccharospirillaceae bacterium]